VFFSFGRFPPPIADRGFPATFFYELKEVIDQTYDSIVIYKFKLKPLKREVLGLNPPSSEDLFI